MLWPPGIAVAGGDGPIAGVEALAQVDRLTDVQELALCHPEIDPGRLGGLDGEAAEGPAAPGQQRQAPAVDVVPVGVIHPGYPLLTLRDEGLDKLEFIAAHLQRRVAFPMGRVRFYPRQVGGPPGGRGNPKISSKSEKDSATSPCPAARR